MTTQTTRWSLVLLLALTLSACSAPDNTDETSSGAGGMIELALSETCVEGSDSECISVNGENVVLPPEFEQAGVKDAAVAKGDGQTAVDVTFNEDGAEILHKLTEKAAQAGNKTLLVMKVGDEVLAAVRVMEALEGDYVQIILSGNESAEDIVDSIHQS